jgi:hypothetical protein
MTGMKKDERKKEEISDVRARDRLKEQNHLRKINPAPLQNRVSRGPFLYFAPRGKL